MCLGNETHGGFPGRLRTSMTLPRWNSLYTLSTKSDWPVREGLFMTWPTATTVSPSWR